MRKYILVTGSVVSSLGNHSNFSGSITESVRIEGGGAEAGFVHQRGSRHHESLPLDIIMPCGSKRNYNHDAEDGLTNCQAVSYYNSHR